MKDKPNTIREVIRQHAISQPSARSLAKQVGCSDKTVTRILIEAKRHGVTPDHLDELSDDDLLSMFSSTRKREAGKHMPDFAEVHTQLQKHKHATRIELWHAYREQCIAAGDEPYAYSQFNHYYRQFQQRIDLSMRQEHYAGELIYVDFAGKGLVWTDAKTGKEHKVQIFVAVLGCSQYTFAYAVPSQKLCHWIEAHNQMFQFFGGVPEAVVPDNLKSAVVKAGSFPEINRTYLELARHYACAIVPARARKPQDKSLAEVGVLQVTRWITAPLSRERFFSLQELNAAIRKRLKVLNERPFKRYPGCRQSRFMELDKPMLKCLPAQTFEYAEWVAKQKVSSDYHVYVYGHAYSVPFQLVSEKVEARVTSKLVEIFHKNKRVASHPRSHSQGGHSSNPLHRPKSHQAYAQQTCQNYLKWANRVGDACKEVVRSQFAGRPDHSFVASKACAQLKKLCNLFGAERFESACARAMAINSLTVKSVRSILQNGLDQLNDDESTTVSLPHHANVRGPAYYQGGQSHAV